MIRKCGISKLGGVILGYLAFSLLTAGFVYLFLVNTMPEIMNQYGSGAYSDPALEQIVEIFQEEIQENEWNSDDAEEFYRFARDYPNVQMYIEKSGEPIFDSGYSAAVYPAESVIEFIDGPANLAVYFTAGDQFLVWIRFVSLAAGSIIFLVLFLFLLQKKLSYILKISHMVQNYEGGMTSERIAVVGTDELSSLADHINRMADSLQEEQEEQDRLVQSNSKLVSSLSHDIRTPLTAMISYLDLVQTGKYDLETSARYLQIISAKTQQIKNLTDRLFDHSMDRETLSDGEFSCISGYVFAEELFGETVELLKDEGYSVESYNLAGQDLELEMNFFLFRRIWDNLYSNIQKYADKREPVVLTAKAEKDGLMISLVNSIGIVTSDFVESNGIGLENCSLMSGRLGGKFFYQRSDKTFEAVIWLKKVRSSARS